MLQYFADLKLILVSGGVVRNKCSMGTDCTTATFPSQKDEFNIPKVEYQSVFITLTLNFKDLFNQNKSENR